MGLICMEDKRFRKGWSLMVGWTRVRVVVKKGTRGTVRVVDGYLEKDERMGTSETGGSGYGLDG